MQVFVRLRFYSTPTWTRTRNLRIRSPALCPLSYRSKKRRDLTLTKSQSLELRQVVQGVVVNRRSVIVKLLRQIPHPRKAGAKLGTFLTIAHLTVSLFATIASIVLVVEVTPVYDGVVGSLSLLNVLGRNNKTQLCVNIGSTHAASP